MTRQFDSPVGGEEPKKGVSPRLVGAVILIVILVVFVLENTGSTPVKFIPGVGASKVPLWIAVFVPLLLGLFIGVLVGRRRQSKRST